MAWALSKRSLWRTNARLLAQAEAASLPLLRKARMNAQDIASLVWAFAVERASGTTARDGPFPARDG